MDIFETIMTRRSIRAYSEKPVSDKEVRKMLEAAMMAPTARNYQPWYFVVIRERKLLDEITVIHPHAKMLRGAPLAVLICGDKNKENEPAYIVQNCSGATENLLLAAHGLGLGAVWVGVHPREPRIEGIRKLLDLPDYVQPVSLISIGYPAEEKKSESRYRQEYVKYDKWSE